MKDGDGGTQLDGKCLQQDKEETSLCSLGKQGTSPRMAVCCLHHKNLTAYMVTLFTQIEKSQCPNRMADVCNKIKN